MIDVFQVRNTTFNAARGHACTAYLLDQRRLLPPMHFQHSFSRSGEYLSSNACMSYVQSLTHVIQVRGTA